MIRLASILTGLTVVASSAVASSALAAPMAPPPVLPPQPAQPAPVAQPAPAPAPAPVELPATAAAPAPVVQPAPVAPPSGPGAAAYAPPPAALPPPEAAESEQSEETEEGPGHRHGFTAEVSIGAGMTRVTVDGDRDRGGGSATENGLSGLNVGLGGWVTPTTALTLRASGTSFTKHYDDTDVDYEAGFLGPSLQHYVSDSWFLGGGLGLGIAAVNPDHGEDSSEVGFGIDLRAGAELYTGRSIAVHLAAEVTPTILDGSTVTGFAIQLGLQYL